MPHKITYNHQLQRLSISLAQFICDKEISIAQTKISNILRQITTSFTVLINFNKSEITYNKRILLEELNKLLPLNTPIAILCDRHHCPSLHFSLLIFSRFSHVKFFLRYYPADQWLSLWQTNLPQSPDHMVFPELQL